MRFLKACVRPARIHTQLTAADQAVIISNCLFSKISKSGPGYRTESYGQSYTEDL